MAATKTKTKPNLDSVTTINEDGSRYFLHPSDVSGPFTNWRRVTGFLLLAIYVLLPWIEINGDRIVLFDLAKRQFFFFGLNFKTEDLWLGFFVFTGIGFALFYVTAVAGRLWCGWTCPYTVFLEHIYRRIERLIDGDATARRKLDAAPWTNEKITKRVLKHGAYVIASVLIAHVFVSYFARLSEIYESPLANAKALGIITFLSLCLYGSFAWFREQFCIIMCPYGRIQSALTDDDTIVIGYDSGRGEPRGKATDPDNGDCINCSRCVQVCPTGIDIRNGLQLECIGCSACIDACDEIMEKVGREKGLVRYDSLNGLAGKSRRIIRPRIILYTVFLLIGFAAMLGSIAGLHTASAEVNRMSGQPYYVSDEGVRNQYELRLVNKRKESISFAVRLSESAPDGVVLSGLEEAIPVGPNSELSRTFFAQISKTEYAGKFKLDLIFEVTPGDLEIEDTIDFLGPSGYAFHEEREAKARAEKQPAPEE